ncbi:MAG: CBS domain-containing protein [Pseudomonadales bacterium]
MISIDEIMTPAPHTLQASNSIYDARLLMKEQHIRHIPIVNDGEQLIGLITQSDLLAASESTLQTHNDMERMELEKQHLVSEAMTTGLATINENDNLRAAAMYLLKNKHGCLPVTRNGKLCGIITDSDFVTVAVNLMEILEQRELEPDVDPDDDF